MDTINRLSVEKTDPGYWAEQAEALKKLYSNRNFKKVILEGYFQDRAVAGTSILANDNVKQAGARTDVMEGLIAISVLQDHFNTIKMLGEAANAEEDDDFNDVEAINSTSKE